MPGADYPLLKLWDRALKGMEQTMQPLPQAAAAKKKVEGRRLYAALIFFPLFYVLVRYCSPVFFFGLVAGAALLAQFEFYRLHFRENRGWGLMALGLGTGALLLASLHWPGALPTSAVFLLIPASALIYRIVSTSELKGSLVEASVMAFGVLYISLTLGHLVLIRALPSGEYLIFFVVLVTWAGDAGAYYAGVFLGRHQLAPNISPDKTTEGLMGGLVSAVVVALVAQMWFLPSFTSSESLTIGIILTSVGVLGDLSESALKRGAGVKDSGFLIPGHGGMLDRLDSLLFTAPTFYYYIILFG